MKTIFHIIASVQLGGAENVALSLCENLTRERRDHYRFIILELYETKNDYASSIKIRYRELGIEIVSLSGSGKRAGALLAPLALAQHIRSQKPDIIHSHTDLPDFVLSLAMKLHLNHSFRVVRTIHNTVLWPTHPILGRIAESAFRNDTVIPVSDAAKDAYLYLRKHYGLSPSEKVKRIYNGCTVPERATHAFRIDERKVNIAFCGRLELQKGFDIFIGLVGRLSNDLKERVLFHVVGSGSFEPEALKLAATHDCVICYGAVPDLARKLHCFDFVIMPSRFEGFPLLSVEASLSGVPVIATRSPGLEESLPRHWPLFARSLDPGDFATLVGSVLTDPSDRDRLGLVAFDYAMEHFSIQQMLSGYENIYNAAE